MFKEQYKAANDSIPLNEDLLKRLVIKGKSPQKVIKFKKIYKYSAVAAAIVLCTLSAVLFTKNSKFFHKTSIGEVNQLSNLATAPSTPVPQNNAKEDASAFFSREKETAVKSDTSSNTSNNTAAFEDKKLASEKIQPQNEEAYFHSHIAMADEASPSVQTYSESTQTAELSSAAKGASSRKNNSVPKNEQQTVFDLDTTLLTLPQGVVICENLPNENTSSNDRTITGEGNGKSFTLSLKPNTACERERSDISDDTNGEIAIYVTSKNYCAVAKCKNFTPDEAQRFADSLKQ